MPTPTGVVPVTSTTSRTAATHHPRARVAQRVVSFLPAADTPGADDTKECTP